MGKKSASMIDSLFGSRTRVKLLHLFYNNPGKSFYVREITRLIDEQINSVRRELSNMLEVGVITSNTADNKLFYEVSQRYEYYAPLRQIFGDSFTSKSDSVVRESTQSWERALMTMKGVRAVVAAGKLVDGSASHIDILIVGSKTPKLLAVLKSIESSEGRELTYAIMEYEEFYYRLSVRDKFVMEPLTNRHRVILDRNNVLKDHKE
jgi:hypothetical protein